MYCIGESEVGQTLLETLGWNKTKPNRKFTENALRNHFMELESPGLNFTWQTIESHEQRDISYYYKQMIKFIFII